MPTECSRTDLDLGSSGGRRLVGAFDGGAITSNGGVVLLAAADRAIGLSRRLALCFTGLRFADAKLDGMTGSATASFSMLKCSSVAEGTQVTRSATSSSIVASSAIARPRFCIASAREGSQGLAAGLPERGVLAKRWIDAR